jgi:hypothetical protein
VLELHWRFFDQRIFAVLSCFVNNSFTTLVLRSTCGISGIFSTTTSPKTSHEALRPRLGPRWHHLGRSHSLAAAAAQYLRRKQAQGYCQEGERIHQRTLAAQLTTQISNLCETKPGLKSYAGKVSIPATPEFPFEQNLFFWLFESRHKPKTDPLTLWINGGPGSPSIDQVCPPFLTSCLSTDDVQALGHNGPCKVNPDSKTTTNNPWSWNNRANLLYIDQPIHTGFSFDVPSPGRINLTSGDIYFPGQTPSTNSVLEDGIFSSQSGESTIGSSQNVARVLWTFMQTWSADSTLKAYSRPSIHLWSQS